MNLIDRYVTEVGKRLPRRSRADIEAELSSTLHDMLEDRSRETGQPIDDVMTRELLQEYGAPVEVADSYLGPQYLIGPRLFPTFVMVLKIVGAVLVVVLSIMAVVSLIATYRQTGLTAPELLQFFGQQGMGIIGAIISAFGSITLTFAILERVLPAGALEDKDGWNPSELTQEPDPDRVSVGEQIFSLVVTAGALILFNFYPQVVGLWLNLEGEWVLVARLSEAFYRYLPWINLAGLLTIALDLATLRGGVWRPLTRWLEIGLNLITIGLASAMLLGPTLLERLPAGVPAEVGDLVTGILIMLIPAILGGVIIAAIVEIVQQVWRLINRRETLPSLVP